VKNFIKSIKSVEIKLEDKKEYIAPKIIHEIDLETKAGSPTGPDVLPPGLGG
jgi:hypothetical protein